MLIESLTSGTPKTNVKGLNGIKCDKITASAMILSAWVQIMGKSNLTEWASAAEIAQFLDVLDSLSIHLLPLESYQWPCMCAWACVHVPQSLRTRRIRGITFWCTFHQGVMPCSLISSPLAPAWRKTSEQQRNCTTTCVHKCLYVPIYLHACVFERSCVRIEYAHCTQPAQGEDPFSHQIFTSNHRLPAACCYNAHTLVCYWFPMHSLKKRAS